MALAHTRALLASSPPGSTGYVDADVRDTSRVLEQAAEMARRVAQPVTPREYATVARLFAGLEPVPPGVVRVPEGRPTSAEAAAAPSTQWGGVGQKA